MGSKESKNYDKKPNHNKNFYDNKNECYHETRKAKKVKLKAKDLLAQAVCHEIDHLNGIVFIDLVIPGTLEYISPEDNK